MRESGSGRIGNNGKILRELVDGDPDSQGSKIVNVRSPLLSEISENYVKRRVEPSIEEQGLISDL